MAWGKVKRYRTRRAWLRARRDGIGGSDSAALFNASNYTSEFSIYASKVSETDDKIDSERLEIRRELEPVVARLYKKRTGRRLINPGTYAIHYHPVYPFIYASLDRIVPAFDNRGPMVFEAKTSNDFSRAGFSLDPDSDDPLPVHIDIQVQHQLCVTGYKWAVVAVLFGIDEFRYYEVERADEWIGNVLIPRLREFWYEHVAARVPPPVDGKLATRRALDRLHPNDNGETVVLPDLAYELDERRSRLVSDIARLREEKAAIDNWYRAAIGPNTYGEIGDISYSLKTQGATRVLRRRKY